MSKRRTDEASPQKAKHVKPVVSVSRHLYLYPQDLSVFSPAEFPTLFSLSELVKEITLTKSGIKRGFLPPLPEFITFETPCIQYRLKVS